MTARPILFSGPMIRAILAGTKTQTRRVCRHQHDNVWVEDGVMYGYDISGNDGRVTMQYGDVGDTLWVRETWGLHDTQPSDGPERAHVYYRATDSDLHGLRHQLWRPSIFMPRWASRITLRVTAVRVERLQEISEADAVAEGVDLELVHRGGGASAFRELWESINAVRAPWASNPFVWRIEFTRVDHA